MADLENPDLDAMDSVAIAERGGEETNWILLMCVALTNLGASICVAFILFGTPFLHKTSKAVHVLVALVLTAGIFVTLLMGTHACAVAVATCIFGDYEGKQQDQALPQVVQPQQEEGPPHVQPQQQE
jgi:hypothetical protein